MNVDRIKDELIKQKNDRFEGNIYYYSQVNFSYNSNKIEGSRLTSDQTEAIFDTSSLEIGRILIPNICNVAFISATKRIKIPVTFSAVIPFKLIFFTDSIVISPL